MGRRPSFQIHLLLLLTLLGGGGGCRHANENDFNKLKPDIFLTNFRLLFVAQTLVVTLGMVFGKHPKHFILKLFASGTFDSLITM